MSLVLKKIRHRYGAAEAVAGVDLDVAAGEIVCLVGPSGCGKTTLLRLAAGLEQLQAGDIELEGCLLASGDGRVVPPEKRPVGFVFQDYVLFPQLTALKNVEFGLAHVASGDRGRMALAELERVGLNGLENRFPHELSGGQQQRVALARALVRRPRAMLLDEPFASIDAVLRRRLREDVRRMLKDADAAVILVTHDAEEALALADRVALMDRGKIVETGEPKTLFETPSTLSAALLFPGAQRLEGVSENGVVRTAFGDVAAPKAPSGPVDLVFAASAARLAADAEGRAVVVESRFAGPRWTVYLTAKSGNGRLRVESETEFESGASVALLPDPAAIHVFKRPA